MRHGAGEYGRVEIHTNTVEGSYSVLKRGVNGVDQHCKARHLSRYVTEFDFRYNNRVRLSVNDAARTVNALRGVVGKRLIYKQTSP